MSDGTYPAWAWYDRLHDWAPSDDAQDADCLWCGRAREEHDPR